MKCGCDNCFECPYADCILDELEEKAKADKKKLANKKRHAIWYQANRERVKAKALANYYEHREQRNEQKKEYYKRKKMEGLLDATK